MVLWKILARSQNLGNIIDGSQRFKFFLLTGPGFLFVIFSFCFVFRRNFFLSLGLKFWFPNSGSLLVSQMANYHTQKQAEQQLITIDNTQNSCDRRVLHVHQDLVIIICKGVFFNLSIFPVHTNTLSTCLPTWLLITLSRFSWDSLFLICSGEAVCFCVAVKTRFEN